MKSVVCVGVFVWVSCFGCLGVCAVENEVVEAVVVVFGGGGGGEEGDGPEAEAALGREGGGGAPAEEAGCLFHGAKSAEFRFALIG